MKYQLSSIPTLLCVAASSLLAGGDVARAHFDILVARPAIGNQTLIGAALVPDDLNLETRIFEGDVEADNIAGNNFYTGTEPGFFNAGANSPGSLGATNPPGALPLLAGESFTVHNVSFALDGVTSDLFYWDGVGDVSFVDSPADIVITQTGGTAGADGSIDAHPFYDIDDPASDALPAGGIYVAPLTVELDGLASSDTALVMLVTGEEFEDSVEAAELYLAGQLVPEPSSLMLAAATLAVGLFVSRR